MKNKFISILPQHKLSNFLSAVPSAGMPNALLLGRPSKTQLIWSLQTILTSWMSLSSASKPDCCYDFIF